MAERAYVRQMRFTFDLAGTCIYCEKPCKRQRTIIAASTEDAQARADAAQANLYHRKCGGQ